VGIVQTRAEVGNGSSKPASQLGSTSRGFRGTTNVLVLNCIIMYCTCCDGQCVTEGEV
jgi:hypothetical protein